eukprot:3874453-Rhodomonas_salina.1
MVLTSCGASDTRGQRQCTPCPEGTSLLLVPCYAGATRCPVLTYCGVSGGTSHQRGATSMK